MADTKELKAEGDYWYALQGLGEEVYSIRHSAYHAEVEIGTETEEHIDDIRELKLKLVNEIVEKFNVIFPDPGVKRGEEKPAPEGKEHYWHWYERVKAQLSRDVFNALVCSGCPFTSGYEGHYFQRVPCGICSGYINIDVAEDEPRSKCPADKMGDDDSTWREVAICERSEETLDDQILREFGFEEYLAFKDKQAEIEAKAG
ncbi:MAG: hypothetical protein Q7S53_03955 [bacterium]|nr:hypothetical protein [bacterium]